MSIAKQHKERKDLENKTYPGQDAHTDKTSSNIFDCNCSIVSNCLFIFATINFGTDPLRKWKHLICLDIVLPVTSSKKALTVFCVSSKDRCHKCWYITRPKCLSNSPKNVLRLYQDRLWYPFEAFKLQQSLHAHEIYCCFKTTPWDSENLMEIGNRFISRAGQDCL